MNNAYESSKPKSFERSVWACVCISFLAIAVCEHRVIDKLRVQATLNMKALKECDDSRWHIDVQLTNLLNQRNRLLSRIRELERQAEFEIVPARSK